MICIVLTAAVAITSGWGRTSGHQRVPARNAHHTVRPHASQPPAKTRHSVAREQPHHPAPQRSRHVVRHRPLIVIDPGHGGKDSGAVGARGTLEKDVTLAAARELRHLLLATGKYRVVMTRTGDQFVPLRARVAFARSHHAAVVIAIHANASRNRNAHGASVWVRSGTDSITPLAADPARIADALAARPAAKPGSAWLQYTLIDNLSDTVRMDDAPARQARFYVLRLPDTPSVLLEMGFLTNRRDETLLCQPGYRRRITEAIRDAIDDYFTQIRHPDAKQT
ncbi:MAG TPA: N-acetylmuramoyl-L-alanine amidase [Rhodopila sp.]|nr:N-acetylmuramoyl-L-alanine amidase [Rhodopila sp.]